MSTAKKISIGVKGKKEFFARGKEIAHMADKGKEIPHEMNIWFEDVADFNHFISENKIKLLAQIREAPCSITELAKRIHRNRSAVTRDVNELEESGLIQTEMVSNEGHGRSRLVKPIAKHLVLQIRI